jgi:hypothetical protein
MKNILIPSLVAVALVLVGLFAPVAAPEAAQIKPHVRPPVFAEVQPVDASGEYQLCGVDVPDSEVILVSPDLGECGDSLTIRFIDGSVISSQIAGILLDAPEKQVQVYNLETPQVTEVVRHY